MTYKEAIEQVSTEIGLPKEVVKFAYESYWRLIRESISKLPLLDDLTEEQFSKLRTNFNIPSIGKLNCTYNRYAGIKKRFKQLKTLKDGRLENKTSN